MVKQNLQSGVTLVELMVVIFIFVVVASVLMFNFSDFSTNVSVRNLAQDIALTVRKAQSYATSVRSINDSGVSSDQFPAYGLSFSVDNDNNTYAPNPKQFILFADIGTPTNSQYDRGANCGSPTAGDECVESFGITSADKIVLICPDNNCSNTGTVNIMFRRPVPDADICVMSGGSCQSIKPSSVKIVVESARGLRRNITVWNTGQISVD